MNGYAFNTVFDAEDVTRFNRATELVRLIDEGQFDVDELRCHEVTRAVVKKLGLEQLIVDGHFDCVEHSWIVLKAKREKTILLDVYSVARLPMVQLVDVSHYSVWRQSQLYQVGARREDINLEVMAKLEKMLVSYAERSSFVSVAGGTNAESSSLCE